MRAGRKQDAESGRFANGSPAFGYTTERAPDGRGKVLVENPAEHAAIARMIELHEQGLRRDHELAKAIPAETPLSTRHIATVLSSEGFAPKRGGAWHSATIARILRRKNVDQRSQLRSLQEG